MVKLDNKWMLGLMDSLMLGQNELPWQCHEQIVETVSAKSQNKTSNHYNQYISISLFKSFTQDKVIDSWFYVFTSLLSILFVCVKADM